MLLKHIKEIIPLNLQTKSNIGHVCLKLNEFHGTLLKYVKAQFSLPLTYYVRPPWQYNKCFKAKIEHFLR